MLNPDYNNRWGQDVFNPFRPLQQSHGRFVIKEFINAESIGGIGIINTVQIHMVEYVSIPVRVLLHNGKSRTADGFRNPQTTGKTTGKNRLSRAKISIKCKNGTGRQFRRKTGCKCFRFLRGMSFKRFCFQSDRIPSPESVYCSVLQCRTHIDR